MWHGRFVLLQFQPLLIELYEKRDSCTADCRHKLANVSYVGSAPLCVNFW